MTDPTTPPEPRATHGRHCPCSACAAEDWTRTDLAFCGMHGPSCSPVYAPMTPPEPVEARDRPFDGIAFLDGLSDDDVMYDYPASMSGEPMDPVLFVRWGAVRAALSEPHPFQYGGLLSTTCARPDCLQSPSARIHRVAALRADTARYAPDFDGHMLPCEDGRWVRADTARVPEGSFVVDRDTLIAAYTAQAWSSPDQMADMLIEGLAALTSPEGSSDD